MFNSVEFVLMFLSMFSSVTAESLTVAPFLFEVALSYDICLQRFPMKHGTYECVLGLIEPLTALAKCCRFELKLINNRDPTVMEAYDMLCAILNPILKRLSLAELSEIEYTAIGGAALLVLPLEELGPIVENWTRRTREGDSDYERFGNLPTPGHIGYLSATPSTATIDNTIEVCDTDHEERFQWWQKIKMDDQTAAAILSYCDHYAAAPTKTPLKRTRRVTKRTVAAFNTTAHNISMEEYQYQTSNMYTTAEDAALSSYGSFSTDSSGMCVGFSPSGRTLIHYTNVRSGLSSRVPPDNSTYDWSDDRLDGGRSTAYCGNNTLSSASPNHGLGLHHTGLPGNLDCAFSLRQSSPTHLYRSKSAPAFGSSPPKIPFITFDTQDQNLYQPQGPPAPRSTVTADMEIPETPMKHNASAFNFGSWPSLSDSVNEIDGSNEFLDSYRVATVPPGFEPNASRSVPIPSLRVAKRKTGVRNLRAVAITHDMIDDSNSTMRLTTSLLQYILMEYRAFGQSHSSSDSLDEAESAHISMHRRSLTESLDSPPRLVGYYELLRAFYERNGGPNATRSGSSAVLTASDSASLFTTANASLAPSAPSTLASTELTYIRGTSSDIYTEYAADWEASQNRKWHSALNVKKWRRVSNTETELSKPNVVKKMMAGVRRKLGTLYAH